MWKLLEWREVPGVFKPKGREERKEGGQTVCGLVVYIVRACWRFRAEEEGGQTGSVSVACGEFDADLSDGELRAVLSSSAGPNQWEKCRWGGLVKQLRRPDLPAETQRIPGWLHRSVCAKRNPGTRAK